MSRHIFTNAVLANRIKWGLPWQSWSVEKFYQKTHRKNCENVIGFTSLPLGIAGPVIIDSRSKFLPMATTEGALIASVNRGCKLLDRLQVHVSDVGMTRAPLLTFASVKDAHNFSMWIYDNTLKLQQIFESTSKHCTLIELQPRQCGREIHLKFRASTDAAMGMNIVTKGCYAVLDFLRKEFPSIKINAVSGNYCTDKKISANNWITGRGKSVIAEVIIEDKKIEQILHCKADDLVQLNVKKNLVGSALAGVVGGFNSQAANVVAAIFAATGQDLAQIGTSSTCITQVDREGGNIVATITMPTLEVGIVGGGTELPTQKDAIAISRVESASDLAGLIGAGVLAGELSLLGSLCAGDLMKAHMKFNRGHVVETVGQD